MRRRLENLPSRPSFLLDTRYTSGPVGNVLCDWSIGKGRIHNKTNKAINGRNRLRDQTKKTRKNNRQ